MKSKMRDSDMPLMRRIDVALRRVTNGEGTMRVPVEATDPDIVLADCRAAIEYYRAGLEKRTPKWVPTRVLLVDMVRGDFPIGQAVVAEAGEHDCYCNRLGAVSVRATNGQMLGVKPSEFEPLAWHPNHDVTEKAVP